LLDEVVALCGTVDETFIRARALNTAGWLHGEIQDHERALDLNGQSLALTGAIETADTEIGNNARLNLGDSLAALGRLDEAEAQFQIVERVVRAPRPQDHWMLWRYSQHLFHSYGELWLARGDSERALAYADECLRGAERTDSKKNLAKAHRLRGQAYVVKGQYREAEAAFDRALLIARQIGNPPQVWKTLASVGDLRRAQGSRSRAQQAYREALAVIHEVAAGLDDSTMREIFLASPHVDRIRRATD
jgi:tetratricopeptide (TPR) repeat protein